MNLKKLISIFLACVLMVGLFNISVFALTKPGNGSDQPNGKFQKRLAFFKKLCYTIATIRAKWAKAYDAKP